MRQTQFTIWVLFYWLSSPPNSPVSRKRCGLDGTFNCVAAYYTFRQQLDELIFSNDLVHRTIDDVIRVHQDPHGVGTAGENYSQFLCVGGSQASLIRLNRGRDMQRRNQERYKTNGRNAI